MVATSSAPASAQTNARLQQIIHPFYGWRILRGMGHLLLASNHPYDIENWLRQLLSTTPSPTSSYIPGWYCPVGQSGTYFLYEHQTDNSRVQGLIASLSIQPSNSEQPHATDSNTAKHANSPIHFVLHEEVSVRRHHEILQVVKATGLMWHPVWFIISDPKGNTLPWYQWEEIQCLWCLSAPGNHQITIREVRVRIHSEVLRDAIWFVADGHHRFHTWQQTHGYLPILATGPESLSQVPMYVRRVPCALHDLHLPGKIAPLSLPESEEQPARLPAPCQKQPCLWSGQWYLWDMDVLSAVEAFHRAAQSFAWQTYPPNQIPTILKKLAQEHQTSSATAAATETWLFLPPVPYATILQWCINGRRLPPKSTWFYPKMPVGFFIGEMHIHGNGREQAASHAPGNTPGPSGNS